VLLLEPEIRNTGKTSEILLTPFRKSDTIDIETSSLPLPETPTMTWKLFLSDEEIDVIKLALSILLATTPQDEENRVTRKIAEQLQKELAS
jgi:hypothetical protein